MMVADDYIRNREFEKAAIALLSVVNKEHLAAVQELKAFTAEALVIMGVFDVNAHVKMCNKHPFRGGGCSDINTTHFAYLSRLSESKKKAKQLIELALRLHPSNPKFEILVKQLAN